jgi:hypothetical protein
MRPALIALFGLAVLVSAPLASADKSKPEPRALVLAPVLSPRTDAALVIRARIIRELPRAADAGDRKTLTRVAAAIRSGKFDGGRAHFAKWAKHATGRLSNDDIVIASLWVTREAGVGSNQELAAAADHVRFADERVDALTTIVADLHAAASNRATTFLVPVDQQYVMLAAGNERKIEHVRREDLATRIQIAEADYDKAVAESDKARASFEVLEKKNRGLVETMLSMVRAGNV